MGSSLIALSLGFLAGLSLMSPMLTLAIMGLIVGVFVLSMPKPDPVVFIAFASLAMPQVAFPGSPLPVSEVLIMIAVVLAALHPHSSVAKVPRSLVIGLCSVLGFMALSTVIHGLGTNFDSAKRLAHVAVYALLAVAIAKGRIPKKAASWGLVVGLGVSSIYGIFSRVTGIGGAAYEGRLTGLFNDPNVAGLLLVVLGPLAVMTLPAGKWRRLFGLLLVVTLVLTLSRTGLLALAIMGVWLLIGHRLRPVFALGLLALLVVGVAFIPTSVQTMGPFKDRDGSDKFRGRILTAEIHDVRHSPVVGYGASTASVVVDGGVRMYFHNSYLGLAKEGGIPALVIFLVILLGAFVRLSALPNDDRNPWIEASLIGVGVVAMDLGEVLLELSAAVAIGYAISHVLAKVGRLETIRHSLVHV